MDAVARLTARMKLVGNMTKAHAYKEDELVTWTWQAGPGKSSYYMAETDNENAWIAMRDAPILRRWA